MTPTIDSIAAALIAEGAPAETAKVAAELFLGRVRYSEYGGTPLVVDEAGEPACNPDGTPVFADALLRSLRDKLPDLFGRASSQTAASAPGARETVTAKATREHREAMARRERQSAGDANPWAAGSVNITQQVLIAHRDPTRAAQLKAEAGVR